MSHANIAYQYNSKYEPSVFSAIFRHNQPQNVDLRNNIPLLSGTDDEDDRTTISSCSSSSTSTLVAQTAKLKRILSEKKLEQLRRAKARKMEEELFRLDNEIAAAEDAVELVEIKDRFYGEQ